MLYIEIFLKNTEKSIYKTLLFSASKRKLMIILHIFRKKIFQI